MPIRTKLEIEKQEYQFRYRTLSMNKAYTSQNYTSKTILTDDVFPYVVFYFARNNRRILKYKDPGLKIKYGNPDQYHHSFYWAQATIFYNAAKALPIESSPLVAYYCMLNAAKAYISYKAAYVDDFVESFQRHGLCEAHDFAGTDLSTICVKRQKGKTVFHQFGTLLEPEFSQLWPTGDSWSLKKLLYNLAYLHRAWYRQ